MYDTHSNNTMNTTHACIDSNNDIVRKTPKPSLSFNRKKQGVRGMLIKNFSFSIKSQKCKRSITPMRRSGSTVSSDCSLSSTELLEQQQPEVRKVRFSNKASSKKVKTQVIEYEKTSAQEAPLYWYTEVEMIDMMEDVKHTVKQYLKKCERYRIAMDKISNKCAQADTSKDSITALLEPRVLLQIANAAARGVEHHVSPRQAFQRQQVVEELLELQRINESEVVMAERYAELSKTARLIAKTMGDGDALVAAHLNQKATAC